MLRARKLVHAFDPDRVRPRAENVRTHLVQHQGEVRHLRLAGSVDDRRHALRQRRRQHDVEGAHDAGIVEDDAPGVQRLAIIDIKDATLM